MTREEDRVALVERARAETGRHRRAREQRRAAGYYGSVARIDAARARGALRAQRRGAAAPRAARARSARRGAADDRDDVVGRGGRRRRRGWGRTPRASSRSRRCRWRCARSSAGTGVRVLVVRRGRSTRRSASTRHDRRARRRAPARRRGADARRRRGRRSSTRSSAGRSVVETTAFVRVASAAARHAPGAMRWIGALMAARHGDGERE